MTGLLYTQRKVIQYDLEWDVGWIRMKTGGFLDGKDFLILPGTEPY
jgi:hypothetical protein